MTLPRVRASLLSNVHIDLVEVQVPLFLATAGAVLDEVYVLVDLVVRRRFWYS